MTTRDPSRFVITPLRPTDRAEWARLFRGYQDFYEEPDAPAKLETTWAWLMDPAHEVNGLVVRETPDGPPVGLAHYRPFARPLHSGTGCFLDDLFVDESVRGTGAADALLDALGDLSRENGWNVVRWITDETNTRARTLYDRRARNTHYVTYDMGVD